jgi:hypothetical protein
MGWGAPLMNGLRCMYATANLLERKLKKKWNENENEIRKYV